MKAVVAAFNQEKALVGAFSVITNLRMELFEALVETWAKRGSVTAVSDSGYLLPCHIGPVTRRQYRYVLLYITLHAALSGHSDYRLHVPLQFCILLSPPRSAQHRVIPNLDPEYNSPHPAPIRPYTLHQDGQHRHPHPHRSFRSQNFHSYSQL